jgi:hypothetical protein
MKDFLEKATDQEMASKLTELRYRRKVSNKTRFLLKLNEKIVCSVCQSLRLLGNEYRRALQGNHWSQVRQEFVSLSHLTASFLFQPCILKGERDVLLANLNFLVAAGNDAHRIVSVRETLKSHLLQFF